MIQQHIWKILYRTKVHAIYLELLHAKTERIDRGIKIFLATTSSSSIAAWAIWKEAALLWTILIAASQVINAVLPLLPYRDRMKALSALSRELEELSIHMEIKWLEISDGELSDKEMKKLCGDMLTKASNASQKHFPNNSIPDDAPLFNKAEETATNYLSSHINQGEICE